MTRITAVTGDITTQGVDVIVNAANSSMLGGGGVDGAIHRAAGPGLLTECREVVAGLPGRRLAVGRAASTGGHDLPARWVVHTVGPNRGVGQTDPADLASCFTASLDEAARLGARTVAFPAISAGIYGWAADDVARIGVAAVQGWVAAHPEALDEVRFVLFGDGTRRAFDEALAG